MGINFTGQIGYSEPIHYGDEAPEFRVLAEFDLSNKRELCTICDKTPVGCIEDCGAKFISIDEAIAWIETTGQMVARGEYYFYHNNYTMLYASLKAAKANSMELLVKIIWG